MKEFVQILLGGIAPVDFLANLFFALLAALVSLLLESNNRNVRSHRTPVQFSWSFLLLDNGKRIATSLILIFLALRFTPQLFGVELNHWMAVLIGLSFDQLAKALKKKKMIGQIKNRQAHSN